MSIKPQQLYGLSTAAVLVTGTILQSRQHPAAAAVVGLGMILSNGAKLNRSVRHHNAGQTALISAESVMLGFALFGKQEWPLVWRTVTNALAYTFEAPRQAAKQESQEARDYYKARDQASINVLAEGVKSLHPQTVLQNIGESINLCWKNPKNWQSPQVYAAALIGLTACKAGDIVSDSLLISYGTAASVLTSNAIAAKRNLTLESNGTLLTALAASTAGYILLSRPETQDAGLLCMTAASSISAIGKCGVKNAWFAYRIKEIHER